MSLEATNIVWSSKLTGSRKLVLLRLADYADKDGGSVYPSVKSLAAACCLSERAVQYTLRGLEADGLLVVVANATGGRGKAREYRIDLERVQNIAPVKGADIRKKGASHSTKGCNTTQERVQPAAPHPPEPPREPPADDPRALARVVGLEVMTLIGIRHDDPTWFGSWGRVSQWLADGADPELDIYPTVRRLMTRKRDGPPSSLNYFDRAIAQAVAERTRPMPTAEPTGNNHGKRHHHEPKRDAWCAIIEQQFG